MIEYNVGHVKWKLASHPPSGFFFGAPNTRFGEYGCFLVTRQKGVAVRRSFSFFFFLKSEDANSFSRRPESYCVY